MTQEEWDLHDKRVREIEVQYSEAMQILAKDDGPVYTEREGKWWKCHTCYSIVNENPCPMCGETHLVPYCKADHLCTCLEEISEGLKYCPVCNQPVCPCGCHDVSQVSRVTGYLADVAGMNMGKQQEVRDRVRNNIVNGEPRRVTGEDD